MKPLLIVDGYNVIGAYEADGMTEKTCADCGVPLDKENFVETKGWISYICKECDEKRHKEWEEDLKKMREEKYTPEPKEDEGEGIPEDSVGEV
jgi:uncharacterized Zn finger protein (UPF0148 family)